MVLLRHLVVRTEETREHFQSQLLPLPRSSRSLSELKSEALLLEPTCIMSGTFSLLYIYYRLKQT